MSARKLVLIGVLLVALVALILFVVAGGERATLPVSAGMVRGRPFPIRRGRCCPRSISPSRGLGAPGLAAPGLPSRLCAGLDHPRWLHVLPTAMCSSPRRRRPAAGEDGASRHDRDSREKSAGAAGPSANRITPASRLGRREWRRPAESFCPVSIRRSGWRSSAAISTSPTPTPCFASPIGRGRPGSRPPGPS